MTKWMPLYLIAYTMCISQSLAANIRILNFDELPPAGEDVFAIGVFYHTSGFTFSSASDFPIFGFASLGTNNPYYAGSSAIFVNRIRPTVGIARSDAGYFDFVSIDLASIDKSFNGTITFEAYRGKHLLSVQSLTLNISNKWVTIKPVNFKNITDIKMFTELPKSFQFDNVVVSSDDQQPPSEQLSLFTGHESLLQINIEYMRPSISYKIQTSTDMYSWQDFATILARGTYNYGTDRWPGNLDAKYYRVLAED